MRLIKSVLSIGIALVVWTCTETFARAADVRLFNVTAAYTPLEVGQRAQIIIAGATPMAPVVMNLNGVNYSMGNTDASGSFSLITNPYTPADVCDQTAQPPCTYTENWYVNGTLINPPPNFPDPTYLPNAPRLPTFSVYATQSTKCAPLQNLYNECNQQFQLTHWILSPLNAAANNSSLVTASDISTAVTKWNNVESKLPFVASGNSSLSSNFVIWNGSLGGTAYGVVQFTGASCLNCYNSPLHCTGSADGACWNASTIEVADIFLDNTQIHNLGQAVGIGDEFIGLNVLEHEMGHTLSLAHPSQVHATCSETNTIMAQGPETRIPCGITQPQSSCDTDSVNASYPSPVGSCSTQFSCGVGSCS